ncbi:MULTISPECIES: hypothetical protein [Pseudomonadota]|uniref:hypothetical protein n=1 Tax=Rheinheimera sp. TaxID=1869214 RepID=UPI004047D3D8
MPPRKFLKKSAKKAVRFAKKRYSTRTGGVRVAQLARDVMKIKRSLNVEHKHIDFKFGSGQGTSAQTPTNSTPIVLPLPVPARGTAYNNRIGNQIRVVHITTKIQFQFANNTDLIGRTTGSVRLLFAKSGDDVPTISDLYELDSNGHYTRNSFTNTQNWKKYSWIKPLNTFKSHTDQVSRYPLSNSSGDTNVYVAPSNQTVSVDDPATLSLNLSKYYVNKQTKTSVKMMFENGSDTVVTMMKPYLLFMADVIPGNPSYDPVSITGTIRMTYVDN